MLLLSASTATPAVAPLRGSSAALRALVFAAILTVVASTPAILLAPHSIGIVLDDAQQFVATLVAIAALSITAVRQKGRARWIPGLCAIGLALIALGIAIWAAEGTHEVTAGGPASGAFMTAVAIFGGALALTWFEATPRHRFVVVSLESATVFAAATTLLGAFWARQASIEPGDLSLMLVEAIAVIAGPVGVALALLDAGVRPGMRGPYALLAGLTLGGASWLSWQALVATGSGDSVSVFDPLVSFSALLVAWAGMTWRSRDPHPLRFPAITRGVVDAFPIGAVAVCVTLSVLTPDGPGDQVVRVGAAAVTGLTLIRQVVLVRSERRTHLAEQESTRRLARESAHRAGVLTSLSHLEQAGTVEATAFDACGRAMELSGVTWAIVMGLDPDGSFRVLAERGPLRPLPVGHRRPAERSAYLAEHAARGPWLEDVSEARDEHLVAMREAGVTHVASAPLVSGKRLIGVIRLGGSGETSQDALAERLIAAREFGTVVGALLAPGLDRQVAIDAARSAITKVITERAFVPVFQPIVRLDDRSIVGYEALTRFADGTRPDLRFEQAALAGMGVDLEIATLAEAMKVASGLPEGAYLSLNVSAELACHPSGIVAALASVGRSTVIEVTEHTAVESYAALRDVLAAFGDRMRIAVDDAGAGYAGLQHILEIRPDIVKLDVSLVRGVGSDPARRALVGAMASFTHDTGAALLAEGIEDEDEALALARLGVTLGQGYLFGRPVAADALAR
jgi:EAL domain-containing protein (putative c-di-GMP-specific phosphodiesterase class I)